LDANVVFNYAKRVIVIVFLYLYQQAQEILCARLKYDHGIPNNHIEQQGVVDGLIRVVLSRVVNQLHHFNNNWVFEIVILPYVCQKVEQVFVVDLVHK